MVTTATLLKVLTSKWTYVALGAAAIIFLLWRVQVLTAENSRLDRNTDVLMAENRGKDNKIGELLLTERELKDNFSAEVQRLEDSLDIQVKQINELTKLKSTTKIEKKVVFKDSIIHDVETDTVYMTRCFTWEDKFTKISGCSIFYDSDTIDILYESTDEIDVVMYWDKPGKWFLPRLFQKKRYEVAVVNANPNNTLIISNRIKIKRKNR